MNDLADRFIDVLLWEELGGQTPPDLAGRILRAAAELVKNEHRPRVRPRRRKSAGKGIAHRVPLRRIAYGRWIAVAACLAIIAGTVLYNYRQAERFPETLVAHVTATSPGVKIVREGNQITATLGMPILIGDGIRTGRDRRLALKYDGERTRVKLGENSSLDIESGEGGKRLHLETGALDAVVAPQPEGFPMVVSTPQALAQIRGTSLSLATERDSTRLDVIEGLVRLTRRSDGAFVDVSGGMYAIAADGVGLSALPRPAGSSFERPATADPDTATPTRGEALLFEEDCDGSLDNWEVVTGTSEEGFRPVASNPERYAGRGETTLNKRKIPHLVINGLAMEAPGLAGIRSRKPIDAERFAVEAVLTFVEYGPASRMQTTGIEIAEKDRIETARSKMGRLSNGLYRWEFAPATHAPEPGMRACRLFQRAVTPNDPTIAPKEFVFRAASYVRPTSTRIVIACGGMKVRVHRVQVRTLPDDHDVE